MLYQMTTLRQILGISQKDLIALKSAVCKNDHDIAIFETALLTRVSSVKISAPDLKSSLVRKLMANHIKTLVGTLAVKWDPNFDALSISRWFYTQKLVDLSGEDPVFPLNYTKNEGLWYELTRGNVSINRIKSIENLLHQLINSYHKNPLDIPSREIIKIVDEGCIRFRCGLVRFDVNPIYYDKLSLDYIGAPEELDQKIFYLLCRYQTLVGSGYHAGIMENCFKVLVKYLQVSHELFASPLNHTLDKYNSAYPDTDMVFGSQGNFFEIYPKLFQFGGSFQANPPFLEEHMAALALIIVKELESAVPLSFVVIVPAWVDTVLYYIFMSSKYNVLPEKYYSFDRHKHYYRDGGAYLIESGTPTRKSNNKSLVFILQNKAGQDAYPVTAKFERELREAFS